MLYASCFRCFEPNPSKLPYKNPDGSKTVHLLLPQGKWFINGLCKTYEGDYPKILEKGLTEEDWRYIMNRINDCGYTYFPCNYALLIGYLFSFLTCFLSFLIPMCCAYDMIEAINQEVDILNDRYFKPKGMKIVFVRKWLRTSWVIFFVY